MGQDGGWPKFDYEGYVNRDEKFWADAADWVVEQVSSVQGQVRIGGE